MVIQFASFLIHNTPTLQIVNSAVDFFVRCNGRYV